MGNRSLRLSEVLCRDSRRAQLKSRILTYTLQSNRAVLTSSQVDPTCRLCENSPETRQHFLAECQILQHVRQKFYTRIQHIVDPSRLDIISPISLHEVTQLILDPSVFYTNKNIIDSIELNSRELISSKTNSCPVMRNNRASRFQSLTLNYAEPISADIRNPEF